MSESLIKDEKNQILQTNVWLTMKWNDFQLRWNPLDYGNISNLHVPSDRVWLPDIVLFNKFPFDEQSCTLVFGSWTYNSDEVVLNWYNNIQAVQLTDYSYSGIWDVIDVPGYLINKRETKESKIVFHVVIRRKTLFYTVILIIPTVLMAFLSMMAFYLPADSAEKISLTINLLLALVVFLLLVSKILPPTSNIPLMGKYLLMAFVLNITTVVVTVVIVNVYFRSPISHEMPNYVRQIFLEFLPRVLMMRRPERIPIFNGYFVEEYCASEIFDASLVMPSMTATMVPFLHVARSSSRRRDSAIDTQQNHHQNCSKWRSSLSRKLSMKRKRTAEQGTQEECCMEDINENTETYAAKISREMKTTVEAIAYIAEHMKAEMSDKKIRDDWKYVAMVIDRLLLLLFFGVTLGGTLGIICSAPHVFDFVDQEKVAFSLALVLLINIDEKNQIMHTNVWPTMRWIDYQMRWDPRMYGNIGSFTGEMPDQTLEKTISFPFLETIRVPPDKVWLPDIVLFNNADGNYLVSFYSNVVVEHTGEMLWVPPAVYKSSCIIDVEYFPFDEQVCSLTFGSWTFRKEEVQISYHMGKRQVELNDYSFSGIWDVMEVPGLLIEDRSKISYQIRIRRKTLFYTVILIMPTVLMAFLSMMVFYLPCEASEKITLAISILLALVVFLLLVSKVTVVIINVYFRGPATHTMPNWHLPMLLIMRRPESTEQEMRRAREAKRERRSMRGVFNAIRRQRLKSVPSTESGDVEVLDARGQEEDPGLSNEATQAMEAIEYITRHLTRDNDYKRQCDEWKYVSMVLDRLLLYIFFAATAGGTMGVLFSAPNVFEYVDQAAVIQNLKQAAVAEQNTAGFSP
ncbi:Neurotransmitter-gated ion-channel ligand binding domain protein [Necator americanus]|uniref:Neurotransmitter-gated ion-channel ligand binding domain protein n=1 Tax=Necator americanus TaxID=51031 RepID=W2SXL1_NECAM|nr:Neurotransmitter-gated ion-channel ligand binding domain protein [Necator americanus]ETN73626.1 Neurotransmitter-gated ion-channel ligand binding domain protein [Necator americanus]